MQLFCTSCAGTFSGTPVCPNCRCRLISPSEAFALSVDRVAPPPDPVRPTVFSRIVVGSVVAAGLFLGLREWAIAGAQLAGRMPETGFWLTNAGVATAFGLRALAVTVGGSLAGAGRPSGFGTGAVVGIVSGGALLMLDSAIGIPLRPLEIGFTIALVVVASLAGGVGSSLWPGPSKVPVSIRDSSRGSSLLQLAHGEGQLEVVRPTHWVRVLIAAVVGIAGVFAAESIRLALRSGGGEIFNLGNPSTFIYVDLEIAIIIVAFAAMAAGASTGTGLRHGILFGLLLAGGVIVMSLKNGDPLPAVAGWLAVLDLPSSMAASESLLAVAVGLFGLGVAGGVFGNALLPPLGKGEQRSRRFK